MRGRASLRGQQSTDTSAYSAHNTRADLNPLDALGRVEALELASKCLFFGVLTLIGLFFFAGWFLLSNFVA